MKSLLIALLLSGSALAFFKGPVFTRSERDIIDSLRCVREVQRVLNEWKFTGEWSKHLSPAGNDGVILNSPTRDFASWVSLNIVKNEVSMELVRPLAVKRLTFTKECQAKTEFQVPKPTYSLEGRFTDAELKEFIDEHPKGLVYVWSANMPWSVEGIEQIRTAARELGVPVKVVMSPLSDRILTEKLVTEKRVTREDTMTHASLEFVMRGMTIHDPAVLSFRNGHLARWARPGRENKSMFVKYYSRDFR